MILCAGYNTYKKNIYYTNYYHETAKTTQPDKKKRVEELQWWRKTSWNRWYRERKKSKKEYKWHWKKQNEQ